MLAVGFPGAPALAINCCPQVSVTPYSEFGLAKATDIKGYTPVSPGVQHVIQHRHSPWWVQYPLSP